MTEDEILDSQWTPDEIAIIHQAKPELIHSDGRCVYTRREMRAMAARYPTLFKDPPPKSADPLVSRYPTMYRK